MQLFTVHFSLKYMNIVIEAILLLRFCYFLALVSSDLKAHTPF